jgi:hypothetical protein
MLPAYIIHDILERERRWNKERSKELLIDPPPIDSNIESPQADEGGESEERGVVVIDFTV